MNENEYSKVIVDSAFEVHRTLGGAGLLENVYEESLYWELQFRGLLVAKQLEVPINYKCNLLASPLRLDLLVENRVIVEVKAVAEYNTIFESQLLTYLRMMKLRHGFVINFGEKRVENLIHPVVNSL